MVQHRSESMFLFFNSVFLFIPQVVSPPPYLIGGEKGWSHKD